MRQEKMYMVINSKNLSVKILDIKLNDFGKVYIHNVTWLIESNQFKKYVNPVTHWIIESSKLIKEYSIESNVEIVENKSNEEVMDLFERLF